MRGGPRLQWPQQVLLPGLLPGNGGRAAPK
jgi:hypothetical protein